MTAQEYLTELKRLLCPLSDDERKEAVAFYYESIADRIDEGLTEEEAVAKKLRILHNPHSGHISSTVTLLPLNGLA